MRKAMKDMEYEIDDSALEKKYSSYSKGKNDESHTVANAKGTTIRFFGLLKPYWFSVAIVCLASVGYTLINVVAPDYMADIIDSLQLAIENYANYGTAVNFGSITDSTSIFYQLFTLGALYALLGIMSFVQQFFGAGVTQKLVFNLRKDVNNKLSKLPLSYFDRNTKGEIISRVINDIDNVSNNLQNSFLTVLTGAVQVVGSLYMMLHTGNWVMTVAAVFLVPFSGVISYRVSRISRKWYKRYWNTMAAMNGHVEEMYTGHSIVRIFNYEKQSIDEFRAINTTLKRNSFTANMIAGILKPILTLCKNINYVSVCIIGGCYYIGTWFGTGRAVSQTLSLGSIEAFLSYSSLFSSPITSISSMINSIQSSLASAERVFTLLDEEEQSPDNTENEPTEPLKGTVEFNHVDFRYKPDVPLIEDFSMKAEPGDLVAIVGPTGAGKTTIVNLLMRFYDIQGGNICIDGIDINTMSRNALRDNFGMVLQDTWLFKGTIRENICYGAPDATDEEIENACKSANIHDYIMSLPKGYDTELTEDGTNVSQGQRQLMTIARALLKNPKVLILDEATSSVDTRTELLIQNAMKELMAGRTSFVIAHRLSTIKNADNIIVMRHGKIVEQGTHAGLLKKDGFYAKLYNSQFTGGIPEDIE
ncbi:MAG: ABC transporter ATP-binding protein/permease [Clostridiales bacterium]|nr:ABC transporter ATP-binding protein/permease [Clostridiales bacterium]